MRTTLRTVGKIIMLVTRVVVLTLKIICLLWCWAWYVAPVKKGVQWKARKTRYVGARKSVKRTWGKIIK